MLMKKMLAIILVSLVLSGCEKNGSQNDLIINNTEEENVVMDENDDYESRIRKLGIKLREAVEIENYEEAARLRDMIHQLKKMDNTDDSTQGGGHDA